VFAKAKIDKRQPDQYISPKHFYQYLTDEMLCPAKAAFAGMKAHLFPDRSILSGEEKER
jgi:hypothetical protein